MASEQFGTNLRATVASTAPNFIRGAVVPLTALFQHWKAPMGADEFVGQVEVQARWQEGYGAMTVADASRVKK